MDNFTLYAPTHYTFGKNAEYEVGNLVKKFNGSRVLLHYGGGSCVKSGLLDIVKNSLTEQGVFFIELGGVQPNPKSGLVYKGIEICKQNNLNFVLAVGGGSVIDSSKAIAIGAVYDGDFWDFYRKGIVVPKALPVGTVLTIAAAGSEGSGDSVITHENGNFKWAARGEAIRPKFSILNPQYTCSLPLYQTACGITDIFVHLTERYFSNTQNVEVTDRLLEGLLKTIVSQGKKCILDSTNYDIRANIMWTGTMAHNNTCGVGREQDWASHGIEHELSALYDCAHGAGLAVIFPAWLEYVSAKNPTKVIQFANRVFDIYGEDAFVIEKVILAVKEFFSFIGMPINFSQLGAKKEDISFLVEHMFKNNIEHTGNYVKLYPQDVKSILEIASK